MLCYIIHMTHHHHASKLSRNQTEILSCLRKSKEPMSAYAILDQVRTAVLSHPPTVYRALAELIEKGMIDAITQPFIEFSFMRRALVGCLALSLGAPPIGVFLMLRRMSLMGDAMSHAILPGAAIGYLLAGLSLFALTAALSA